MPEKHVLDLLPAYVIGCLDEDDCQVVASHLNECDCCRKGLHAYSRVLEDLPLRIALSEPPPEIRAKIIQKASEQINSMKFNREFQIKKMSVPVYFPLWLVVNMLVLLISTIVNLSVWRRLSDLDSQVV